MRMNVTREGLSMTSLPGADSRRSFLISDILREQTNVITHSTACSTTCSSICSTACSTSNSSTCSTPYSTTGSTDNIPPPLVHDDGSSGQSEFTPSPPSAIQEDSEEDAVVVQMNRRRSSKDAERTRNKTPGCDEAAARDAMEEASSVTSKELKLPRKTRTIFTEQQLSSLELSFEQRKYLGIRDRLDLASELRLTDAQVKTWYQNRRTKWKRETAANYKMASGEDNMAFLYRLLQGQQNSAPLTRPKILFSHEICKSSAEGHLNFPSASSCVYQSGEELVHPIRPLIPPLLLRRYLNIPDF